MSKPMRGKALVRLTYVAWLAAIAGAPMGDCNLGQNTVQAYGDTKSEARHIEINSGEATRLELPVEVIGEFKAK